MPTAGLQRGHTIDQIPSSHADLAQCPPVCALSTISLDGYPQSSVVWCDLEGDFVRVNTMRGFAKERNMRRDPRVALLCYDPRRPQRYVEIRGAVVELTEDGARQHLDDIASRYAGRRVRFFGDVIPAHFAETEVPVLCRIRPSHVVAADAQLDRPAGPQARLRAGRARPPGDASPVRAAADRPLPRSHLDLLSRSICGVFTTMTRDGRPQSSLVRVDFDGDCARVTTPLEHETGRDPLVDRRSNLLVVDPGNTSRYLQIRGDAELVRDGTIRIHARRVTCDAIHN